MSNKLSDTLGIYKIIDRESGKVIIYGNEEEIETEYDKPEWSENEEEICFTWRGNKYFLSEFVNIHNKTWMSNPPEYMLEFDGIMNDTMWSGKFVKLLENGEAVKMYIYTYTET